MSLKLGDLAPDFEATSTLGKLRFHEWLGRVFALNSIFGSHERRLKPETIAHRALAERRRELVHAGLSSSRLYSSLHDRAWQAGFPCYRIFKEVHDIVDNCQYKPNALQVVDSARTYAGD